VQTAAAAAAGLSSLHHACQQIHLKCAYQQNHHAAELTVLAVLMGFTVHCTP